ncbi:MAG: CBS domain-containing protein [Flavobacteriaceae bacterium]|nr:CBS domain-containing protein [Flavobacteriaceae bacterium]
MEIIQYLNNEILPLTPDDKLSEAIGRFKNHSCTHIVVVQDNALLGLLSELDMDVFDPEKKLGDVAYLYQMFFVQASMNWLEILSRFGENESNMMPVLDEQQKYIGYIDLTSLITTFGETPFLTEPGAVVIVEKALQDYSLSEISQIVETENGKLLGALVSKMDGDKIQLTLKISAMSYNEIMQSFRRYGYGIVSGVNDDQFIKNLKERSAYLRRYLDF